MSRPMKISLSFGTLLKIPFGGRALLLDGINECVWEVSKGQEDYICKRMG